MGSYLSFMIGHEFDNRPWTPEAIKFSSLIDQLMEVCSRSELLIARSSLSYNQSYMDSVTSTHNALMRTIWRAEDAKNFGYEDISRIQADGLSALEAFRDALESAHVLTRTNPDGTREWTRMAESVERRVVKVGPEGTQAVLNEYELTTLLANEIEATLSTEGEIDTTHLMSLCNALEEIANNHAPLRQVWKDMLDQQSGSRDWLPKNSDGTYHDIRHTPIRLFQARGFKHVQAD